MNKKILCILLTLFPLVSFSQLKLTGTVKDSTQTIPFANVILTDNKGETTTGSITDENGRFKLTAPQGDYSLKISFMGYASWQKDIPLTSNTDLGTILLKHQGNQLDEVVITAKKPLIEQKVDRLVFNVANTPFGKSGTAQDLLKHTPGVNYRNGALSIIGKGKARVMINGRIKKLSGAQLKGFLNSLQADAIESVEIITTPPAKYSAEGNGGLINIVLKKNRQNRWSNTIYGTYVQNVYATFAASNIFKYNKDKLNFSAYLAGAKNHQAQLSESTTYYNEETWHDNLDREAKYQNIYARFSLNYSLTDNADIGLYYYGLLSSDGDATDLNHTKIYSTADDYLGAVNSVGESSRQNNYHNTGIYYTQVLDTSGWKVDTKLDYLTYQNDRSRHFTAENNYETQQNQQSLNKNEMEVQNIGLSVDFSQPTAWAKLNYGAKWLKTHTENGFYFKNTTGNQNTIEQTNNYDYTEDIYAIYASVAKSFGEKWNVKAGLRAEKLHATGSNSDDATNFTRNKTHLFPTAYVNYNLNKDNSFNLSYSRRIYRPEFSDLNPFRWYLSPYEYTQGNPFLQPQLNDYIELKHTYDNKLISSLYVDLSRDGFSQVARVDTVTKVQVYTRENYYNVSTFGIKEIFVYDPFDWWHSITQLNVFYKEATITQDNLAEPLSGVNASIYTDHIFDLDKDGDISLEATFKYYSPYKQILNRYSSSWYLDLGFNAALMDDKLNLNLAITDLFKTSDDITIVYNNGARFTYHNSINSRTFRMTLSYRFGNPIVKSQRHNASNSAILNRTQ